MKDFDEVFILVSGRELKPYYHGFGNVIARTELNELLGKLFEIKEAEVK